MQDKLEQKMAKHLVFIWELGDNFGHIATFATVAKKLHKKGYRLTAILQNLTDASRFFKGTPIQLLQAPVAVKKPQRVKPQNYTDDIRNCGYHDAAGLEGLLRGWQSLYALLKPDLVLFNSAPTAMAAAKNETFQKIALGQGYEIPPLSSPLPPFLPQDATNMAAMATREKEVLALLNKALGAIGLKPYKHFHEVFAADKTLLTTTPELDHYTTRQKGHYIGTLSYVEGGTKLPWPEMKGKRIFAYLRPQSKFFVPTLQALHALSKEHSILVSAPNISQKNIQTLTTKGLIIIDTAIQIASIREQCDLAICHAGIGTVSAFLQAGVPLLLLPNHVEQWMMAQCVLRLGAGAMPKGEATQAQMQRAIVAMLATPAFKEKAEKYQQLYKSSSNSKTEDAIVEGVEALLKPKAKVKPAKPKPALKKNPYQR